MTSSVPAEVPKRLDVHDDWAPVASGCRWSVACHGMAMAFDIALDLRGRALGLKEYAVVVHALEPDGSRTEPRPESTWRYSNMLDGYYVYLGDVANGARWIAPTIKFDTPVAGIEILVYALPQAPKTSSLESLDPWVRWIEPFTTSTGGRELWAVMERASRKVDD